MVRTTDFYYGYLRMVSPEFLRKPWYMFGDHGPFSPVEFV